MESQGKETFDIALEMTVDKNLPIAELVTHRFEIDHYREALIALENRAASKAIKAVFQHIV
jgi:threonine dehydrogenase-like Zn-dependent dehydrogenase